MKAVYRHTVGSIVLLVSMGLAMPVPAIGQETSQETRNGAYVSVSAGAQYRQTVHEVGTPATFIDFGHAGVVANGAVGYRFRDFRGEGEMSFFNNPVTQAGAGTPVGNFQSAAVGAVSLRTYMANVYYDVPLGKSRVRPYGGGGIGFYQSQINGLLPQFFGTLGMPTTGINATSNAPFAYQFRGGLDYELSRRVVFFAGYRFFHGNVLTFSAVPFGTFHPNGANMHSIEAGFRFGIH